MTTLSINPIQTYYENWQHGTHDGSPCDYINLEGFSIQVPRQELEKWAAEGHVEQYQPYSHSEMIGYRTSIDFNYIITKAVAYNLNGSDLMGHMHGTDPNGKDVGSCVTYRNYHQVVEAILEYGKDGLNHFKLEGLRSEIANLQKELEKSNRDRDGFKTAQTKNAKTIDDLQTENYNMRDTLRIIRDLTRKAGPGSRKAVIELIDQII